MRKRILSFILLMTMLVSLLVGCGNKETSNNDAPNTEVTENVTTSENLEDTELETESVTEETEATEVVEETQVETTEQPTTTYTYEDMSATMYAKQSVNVRNLPSTDGEKLGALSYAQEVTVTGKCVETGWYRIDFNGSVGYVSNNYLVNEKPAEQPVVPSEPTEPSQPSGRYGGVWNGTTYTNTTYNTSFSMPTLNRIWPDKELDMLSHEDAIALAKAVDYDGTVSSIVLEIYDEASSTRMGYTFSEAGLVEFHTSSPVISAPAFFSRSEIYTTSIGGNTYYYGEVYDNRENRGCSTMCLVRFSGNKLLEYYITGNNLTIDTVKQYILY